MVLIRLPCLLFWVGWFVVIDYLLTHKNSTWGGSRSTIRKYVYTLGGVFLFEGRTLPNMAITTIPLLLCFNISFLDIHTFTRAFNRLILLFLAVNGLGKTSNSPWPYVTLLQVQGIHWLSSHAPQSLSCSCAVPTSQLSPKSPRLLGIPMTMRKHR